MVCLPLDNYKSTSVVATPAVAVDANNAVADCSDFAADDGMFVINLCPHYYVYYFVHSIVLFVRSLAAAAAVVVLYGRPVN